MNQKHSLHLTETEISVVVIDTVHDKQYYTMHCHIKKKKKLPHSTVAVITVTLTKFRSIDGLHLRTSNKTKNSFNKVIKTNFCIPCFMV